MSHIEVLPPHHSDTRLIRTDAFYTLRTACCFTRLTSPQLLELLSRADVATVKLKGKDFYRGGDLLDAIEAVQ